MAIYQFRQEIVSVQNTLNTNDLLAYFDDLCGRQKLSKYLR
jgi:hypothetical protein